MIAFILGTRPEAIKLAPLIARIPEDRRKVIWTGQHYDKALTEDVWADLPRYAFDAKLEIGGDSDGERLAHMIRRLTPILASLRPRWTVVQGDTTTALAGALAARKCGLDVYHVEAGCRSGDPRQPEEWNRKAIDHLSSGWSYPYPHEGQNLRFERIRGGIWSGDIAIDALLLSTIPDRVEPGEGVVVTIHRNETLADASKVKELAAFLCEIAKVERVILYRHPHTAYVMTDDMLRGVTVRLPASPLAFRTAMAAARAVVTDSGGVGSEAAYLGVPCLIARDRTEYVDLVRWDKFKVGGTTQASLSKAFANLRRARHIPQQLARSWSGKASEIVAEALVKTCE